MFDFYQRLRDDPLHLQVLGNGLQRKSYLYVHDGIDAMLLAIAQTEGKVHPWANQYLVAVAEGSSA